MSEAQQDRSSHPIIDGGDSRRAFPSRTGIDFEPPSPGVGDGGEDGSDTSEARNDAASYLRIGLQHAQRAATLDSSGNAFEACVEYRKACGPLTSALECGLDAAVKAIVFEKLGVYLRRINEINEMNDKSEHHNPDPSVPHRDDSSSDMGAVNDSGASHTPSGGVDVPTAVTVKSEDTHGGEQAFALFQRALASRPSLVGHHNQHSSASPVASNPAPLRTVPGTSSHLHRHNHHSVTPQYAPASSGQLHHASYPQSHPHYPHGTGEDSTSAGRIPPSGYASHASTSQAAYATSTPSSDVPQRGHPSWIPLWARDSKLQLGHHLLAPELIPELTGKVRLDGPTSTTRPPPPHLPSLPRQHQSPAPSTSHLGGSYDGALGPTASSTHPHDANSGGMMMSSTSSPRDTRDGKAASSMSVVTKTKPVVPTHVLISRDVLLGVPPGTSAMRRLITDAVWANPVPRDGL